MCVIFFYAIVNLTIYPFACGANIDVVLTKLEKGTFIVFISFQNKYLKANSRKSYVLTRSGNVLHIIVGGINSVVVSIKNYQVYL